MCIQFPKEDSAPRIDEPGFNFPLMTTQWIQISAANKSLFPT